MKEVYRNLIQCMFFFTCAYYNLPEGDGKGIVLFMKLVILTSLYSWHPSLEDHLSNIGNGGLGPPKPNQKPTPKPTVKPEREP